MKLLDFYTKMVKTVGFTVTEDGSILAGDTNKIQNELNVPIVLPTKENMKSILNRDGSVQKIMFNPLIEDIFTKRNSNISLEKSISFSNIALIYNLANIGSLLIMSIDDTNGNFKLNDFYERTALVLKKLTNVKKLVDDDTLEIWNKIITGSSLDKDLRAIMITQVKKGKIGKDLYNYTTSIHSPLLDYILEKEAEDEKITSILGVKVRPKDIGLIKSILTFMLNGITEEEGSKLSIGSNSEYAALESYLTLYLTVSEYFNEITESCKTLDEEFYKGAKIHLELTLDDLKLLPVLKRDAITIPSERSLDKTSSLKDRINTTRDSISNEPYRGNNEPYKPTQEKEAYRVQDERYNVVEPPRSNYNSLMAKITGRAPIQENTVPSARNYTGPRPDLHVGHIYDEAPRYRVENERNIYGGSYNPNGRSSRLSDNATYVPASERRERYSRESLYGRGSKW